MEAGGNVHHLLGLKVMRLTKPSLQATVPVLEEPWDIDGKAVEGEFMKDVRCPPNLPEFSTGQCLGLPQSFGMIYLGEVFTGFVTVHNDSQEVVKEVIVKVELRTPSQRVHLLSSPQLAQLDPQVCEEWVLSHEVKELGEHSLICSSTYTVHTTGEELVLVKFFKFNVAKPLDVKTKFLNLEDDILLEVQIQNTTLGPIFLEIVNFDPAAGFRMVDLNKIENEDEEDASVFGTDNWMVSRSTRQYLFKITPLDQVQIPVKSNSVSVGKMDIIWRSRLGNRGRIQTGQLKAVVPALPELKLSVVECPGTVQMEQAFKITCLFTNTTEHPMRLRLQLERQPGAGVLWSGVTSKVYNELPGNSSMEIQFTVVPVQPGLQSIGPLTLVDLLSNQKKYHFTSLSQVFVEHVPITLTTT